MLVSFFRAALTWKEKKILSEVALSIAAPFSNKKFTERFGGKNTARKRRLWASVSAFIYFFYWNGCPPFYFIFCILFFWLTVLLSFFLLERVREFSGWRFGNTNLPLQLLKNGKQRFIPRLSQKVPALPSPRLLSKAFRCGATAPDFWSRQRRLKKNLQLFSAILWKS